MYTILALRGEQYTILSLRKEQSDGQYASSTAILAPCRLADMRAACDSNTIMLVASAPQVLYRVISPRAENDS